MLVELIYCINAGLEDATIGINAQFDGLTVISGHAVPPDVTVYNQIEHKFVARRQINNEDTGISLPALAIFQAGPGLIEPEVGTIYRMGEYPIVFAYIASRTDSALAARDGGYTMRCVKRFLRDFMENAQTPVLRTQAGIIVCQLIDLEEPPTLEPFGQAEVVASLVGTFRVRETLP